MENVRVPHTKNGVNYGRWIPSNVYRTLTRARCLSHACHSLVINVFIQNLIHINKSKTHFGVVQIIRNTLCISDCCDSNRRMWPCDRQLFFLLLLIHRNQSCFQRFFFVCSHRTKCSSSWFYHFSYIVYFCLSRQLRHIRTHPKIQYIISAQQNTVHFWKTFLFRILFLYFVCSGIRRFVFAFVVVVVLFMVCLRRYKWGSAVVFCASNGTNMANYHFFFLLRRSRRLSSVVVMGIGYTWNNWSASSETHIHWMTWSSQQHTGHNNDDDDGEEIEWSDLQMEKLHSRNA